MNVFQFLLKQGHKMDVPKSFLTRLDLFKRKPVLINADRYDIQSDVDSDILDLFMTRLDGGTSNAGLTPENAAQLRALCDELGFTGFDDELRAVVGRGAEPRAEKELVGVRGRVDRHDVLLEENQRQRPQLERQLQEPLAQIEAIEQQLKANTRVLKANTRVLEAMTRVLDEVQRLLRGFAFQRGGGKARHDATGSSGRTCGVRPEGDDANPT